MGVPEGANVIDWYKAVELNLVYFMEFENGTVIGFYSFEFWKGVYATKLLVCACINIIHQIQYLTSEEIIQCQKCIFKFGSYMFDHIF